MYGLGHVANLCVFGVDWGWGLLFEHMDAVDKILHGVVAVIGFGVKVLSVADSSLHGIVAVFGFEVGGVVELESAGSKSLGKSVVVACCDCFQGSNNVELCSGFFGHMGYVYSIERSADGFCYMRFVEFCNGYRR